MPLPKYPVKPSWAVVPSKATLQKYGLSAGEWLLILQRQGWVCAVCGKQPTTGKFNIDHDHVPGWKKMTAAVRSLHVRGLLCFFCNKYYVGRCITVAKAEAVVKYLQQHAQRLGGNGATT